MEVQQQKKKKKKNMIDKITLLDNTSMGISHVKGVLRRTVCSEWAEVIFILKRQLEINHQSHYIQLHFFSNYQPQLRPEHHYTRLNFQMSLDSEDDFRLGCWNFNLLVYRQPFSRPLSSERSSSIKVCNSLVQTIVSRIKLISSCHQIYARLSK